METFIAMIFVCITTAVAATLLTFVVMDKENRVPQIWEATKEYYKKVREILKGRRFPNE